MLTFAADLKLLSVELAPIDVAQEGQTTFANLTTLALTNSSEIDFFDHFAAGRLHLPRLRALAIYRTDVGDSPVDTLYQQLLPLAPQLEAFMLIGTDSNKEPSSAEIEFWKATTSLRHLCTSQIHNFSTLSFLIQQPLHSIRFHVDTVDPRQSTTRLSAILALLRDPPSSLQQLKLLSLPTLLDLSEPISRTAEDIEIAAARATKEIDEACALRDIKVVYSPLKETEFAEYWESLVLFVHRGRGGWCVGAFFLSLATR